MLCVVSGAGVWSAEPELLVVPAHRVQQQGEEHPDEEHVQDRSEPGQEHEDKHGVGERQTGEHNREPVPPLAVVGDAEPAGPERDGKEQQQAHTAGNETEQQGQARVEVAEHHGVLQGLGLRPVEPAARFHPVIVPAAPAPDAAPAGLYTGPVAMGDGDRDATGEVGGTVLSSGEAATDADVGERHPGHADGSGVPGGIRRGAGGRRAVERAPVGPEQHGHTHRDITGGWARAAVFGVSDGLVTNVSLVLGMAGAHPGPSVVRLAGVAGLIGGAFSMAAGEYVSMRAQSELLERELARERDELRRRPEGERSELVHIYESRGVEPSVARQLADEMMRTPELALETHAREELGVDPSSLGSPVKAGLSSFVTFAFGALLPLLPWLLSAGSSAELASVVVGVVASVLVGASLSMFTGRSWWWSALRQLLIGAAAAGVTFGIGAAVGVSGGG